VAGYTKLFSSIVTSTIWCEDAPTRVVWVAMLALKDRDGVVEGSIPGFARVANVTLEQMERAVKVLSEPDPHSRTPDNEGRRIEAMPGGWRVLNHDAYRDLESVEHRRERDAERQRRHRATSRPVTDCHAPSPHTDADANTDAVPPSSPKPGELTPVPGPSKRKVFVPPTPEEATAYAASIGFKLDGEKFVAHYQARGWKFGTGKPVVDWKACVVTWKKRDESGGGPNAKRVLGAAGVQRGKYDHHGT
jgi:hypothetical protein